MADIGSVKPFIRVAAATVQTTAVLEHFEPPLTVEEALQQSSPVILMAVLCVGVLLLLRPCYVALVQYRADHAVPDVNVPLGYRALRRGARYLVKKNGALIETLR